MLVSENKKKPLKRIKTTYMNKKSKVLHVSIFSCIEVLMNLLDKVSADSEISKVYKKKAEELNKLNENIVDETFKNQKLMSKSTFSSLCANKVETAIRKAVSELKI